MSYYENRIKALEEKVAEMARMQRHKAIPVEAKLVERIAEYQAENTRLKAEVERLRKAGDEVIHEWSSGDEKEARNFMKALVIWNAAKEGKQP
jgi:cell division protein FtsB